MSHWEAYYLGSIALSALAGAGLWRRRKHKVRSRVKRGLSNYVHGSRKTTKATLEDAGDSTNLVPAQ